MKEYKRLTCVMPNGEVRVMTTKFNSKEAMQQAVDRLAELEDAIESGELVRLPCKVGDTVYVIDQLVNSREWVLSNDYTGWEYVVTDIYLNADRLPLFKITHRYGTEKLEDFGRTIFVDKSQAEAKLKELEGK